MFCLNWIWNYWTDLDSDDFLRGFVAKQSVDDQEKEEIAIATQIGFMNDLLY